MTKRPNQLWIIDIDGTIVNVHSNQVPAWLNMFNQVYDVTMDEKTLVSFFGKPFTSVLVEALAYVGIDESAALSKFDDAFKLYIQGVQQGLEQHGGKILPGALEFLDILGKKNIVRAIATGNPQEEAEHKLKYFNLLPYFEIIVYADNYRERSEIVKEAIQKANMQFGINPTDKDIKIVGDSRHDVASAKLINATSIAVASGPTSYENLSAAQPDQIYQSLIDYQTIIKQNVN